MIPISSCVSQETTTGILTQLSFQQEHTIKKFDGSKSWRLHEQDAKDQKAIEERNPLKGSKGMTGKRGQAPTV